MLQRRWIRAELLNPVCNSYREEEKPAKRLRSGPGGRRKPSR